VAGTTFEIRLSQNHWLGKTPCYFMQKNEEFWLSGQTQPTFNEESLLTLKYPHRLHLAHPGESAIAHSSH
jgi:hypothetical protein